MTMSDVLYRLIGRRHPGCPNEADILAFSENRLPQASHARFESHFAECEDCREALAFLGGSIDQSEGKLSDAAASEQTARILSYIRNDEINRNAVRVDRRARPRFEISFARLAFAGLVVVAIAAAGIFVITQRESAGDAGMEALRLAVRDQRRIPARISGGLAYSPYSTTRGERNDDNLNFDRALRKLEAAQQETASTTDRLVLARVYLAKRDSNAAREALTILTQLTSRGVETPEALNDLGVAHLELGSYEDAIASFSRALIKSPAYEEALFNRALAEENTHRTEDARRDWEQFMGQSKDENWKAEARAHLENLTPASRQ